eukprot:TRINITY_DN4806_c0_g1_i1.p1 TRINITY_DN4806_c0_g1~~TRINITY_DN4806_c0_g1_i1.p1  ORF type:complete len:513 (+),score=81.88 TRINITY_DN4806_c0_g1_i1:96-1634(+)
MKVDAITNDILQEIGAASGASRAYTMHFRGERLMNTHEWTRDGVIGFREKLADVTVELLPEFSKILRGGNRISIKSKDDIKESMPCEFAEMAEEDIQSLVLVPIHDPDRPNSVSGFAGFDFNTSEDKTIFTELDIQTLTKASLFVSCLTKISELVTGVPLIRTDEFNATMKYRTQTAATMFNTCRCLFASSPWWNLPSLNGFSSIVHKFVASNTPVLGVRFQLPDMPVELPPSDLKTCARDFKKNNYAVITPSVWIDGGIDRDDLDEFHSACKSAWSKIEPDIEPYTSFRNVAYARFMYRNGSIHGLKYKPFFQVKPEYNVIVGSTPRPFDRIDDSVRDSPVLRRMLQILLEDVWGGELGPEVHIGVHPTRVRNWHNDTIHNKLHATLEGTHVDSTEKVAVMLIERSNIGAGGTTSLYSADCPMGLLRDNPSDEKILQKYRLASHTLKQPFEAITFSDTLFKHDASDFVAADPKQKAWRSLVLIMCRRPNTSKSPIDQRVLDGYTPRTPRSD